ncbi:MAG TPA: hypothetical protein VEC94_08630 [Pseudolabrys sp.]|nr:hypothetical protein [Pseudolabrys sp.]
MSGRIGLPKSGLVGGILLGGCHLCWAALVASGWAQPVIDFILWIHFIKPVYVIEPFSVAIAVILVTVTAAIGFMIGSIFALAWNALHKA